MWSSEWQSQRGGTFKVTAHYWPLQKLWAVKSYLKSLLVNDLANYYSRLIIIIPSAKTTLFDRFSSSLVPLSTLCDMLAVWKNFQVLHYMASHCIYMTVWEVIAAKNITGRLPNVILLFGSLTIVMKTSGCLTEEWQCGLEQVLWWLLSLWWEGG